MKSKTNIKQILEENNIDSQKLMGALGANKGKAEQIIKDKTKIKKLLDKAEKMCQKLSNLPVVGDIFSDVPLMCHMIADYVKGNYKDVPIASIITLTAAIIYLVSPVDLIPDPIPVLGLLDDAGVILLALQSVHNDLMSYSEWKTLQDNN